MKMSKDHYEFLKKKVSEILPKVKEHRKTLEGDPRVKNLKTRWMWDTFHAIRVFDTFSYQEFDYLDVHIETAMRHIFDELKIME